MPALIPGLAIVLVISMVIAVGVGPVAIPIETVWGVIANKLMPGSVEVAWSSGRENIVWDVRAPRVILGAVVGASLAMVGAALQSVTRNPLADPHLLGISSGAAFGAIMALIHAGMVFGTVTVPVFAFAGALAATALVLAIANLARAQSAGHLILAGVAVSFIISAGGNLLIFIGDPKAAHVAIFWMLGGLGLAQWSHLPYPLAALLVGGLWLMTQTRNLNAMTLGDESATALGIPAQAFRLKVFIVCALLTGCAVAYSGVIAFVGLMIPHIVRFFVGGDYRRVLPLSALVGAIFLIAADMAARTVVPPQDMPLGIVTGLIGGVAFVVLMRRRATN
ncbi:iron ABC transporter permease [Aminobacter anthyllidis]|uniref:Iron ABC transporter permease n=1 Tax=Aminobacter anthyllidis TaxID=1035067 RepID=A0A9X1D638_9HYPH|nr:iron ABC transporter permease [Aminobacter anthyllidis]MBT1156631.1 iron ABC transporter permease [Aminobacter anthyllidis]MDH4988376.1 iron ABC transporter permease [Aminobacter anthyllidis]